MIEIYEPLNFNHELFFLIGTCLGVLLVSMVFVYYGLSRVIKHYLSKAWDKKKAVEEAERIIRGD